MKKVIIAVVVVIVVGGGIWLAVGRNKNTPASSNSTSTSSSSNSSTTSSSASNNAPTATDKVDIANMAFSPADITVKKGTSVTWTNQDSIQHTVTENDGKSGPSSSPLDQGKSYSFTFNDTGTFNYHCSIHPEMIGSVTVTD